MNYATGYALSAQELFTRFKLRYIKNPTFEVFKEHSKKKVAARVFIYGFYLIIKDIIDNNTTFLLPTAFQSFIEMAVFQGEDFKKARQNGAFAEVDFLASNFTAYRLQYRYRAKSGKYFTKPIHVHRKLKDIIIQNTNEGKRY
jgi:hypothetical protein